jgi:hypothetical protein
MKTLETITEKDIDEMFPLPNAKDAKWVQNSRFKSYLNRQIDRRIGAKKLLEMLKENLPEKEINNE